MLGSITAVAKVVGPHVRPVLVTATKATAAGVLSLKAGNYGRNRLADISDRVDEIREDLATRPEEANVTVGFTTQEKVS